MKKILLITIFSFGLFACQTAENSNIVNKNSNTNINQISDIEKLRQKLNQPAANRERDVNAIQQQIEQGTSNVSNSNQTTNAVREKLHEIEPEKR